MTRMSSAYCSSRLRWLSAVLLWFLVVLSFPPPLLLCGEDPSAICVCRLTTATRMYVTAHAATAMLDASVKEEEVGVDGEASLSSDAISSSSADTTTDSIPTKHEEEEKTEEMDKYEEIRQALHTASSSSKKGQARKKLLVFVVDRLGLANRFRSLGDWFGYAKLTHRHLVVIWRPNYDCYITLHDLFVSFPEDMTVLSVNASRHLTFGTAALDTISTLLQQDNISSYILNPRKHFFYNRTELFLHPRLLQVVEDVIVTNYVGLFTMPFVPCQVYLQSRAAFYNSLVIHPQIVNHYEDIYREYFTDSLMIGVHIRMHEDAFDWPVVPPLQEVDSEVNRNNTTLQALKFGEATDISHFIDTMKQIQTHFEYEDPVSQQRKSWVKFFIASNSVDTKKQVLTHFPGSVAITEDYPRNHADGVVVAFLDWLLLSKSALILHSHGSTFAEEAGIKSHSPIVSQVASRLVLHHSNLLPYCGIMYYMDFDVVPVEQVGVVDGEPKKYGKINLRLCDRLSHWGLSEVYCATFG